MKFIIIIRSFCVKQKDGFSARVIAATNSESGKNNCYVAFIPAIISQYETTI